MTPVVRHLDHLPTDRPVSYRDAERGVIVVRIYDDAQLSDRRRRELVASLRTQGFVRQPKKRGCGYETYHLKIRTRYDGRRWQPVRLAGSYDVRYLTPDPADPIIERVGTCIIKRGRARYDVISRERRPCG